MESYRNDRGICVFFDKTDYYYLAFFIIIFYFLSSCQETKHPKLTKRTSQDEMCMVSTDTLRHIRTELKDTAWKFFLAEEGRVASYRGSLERKESYQSGSPSVFSSFDSTLIGLHFHYFSGDVTALYSCRNQRYELFDMDDMIMMGKEADKDIKRFKHLIKGHNFRSPYELFELIRRCFLDTHYNRDGFTYYEYPYSVAKLRKYINPDHILPDYTNYFVFLFVRRTEYINLYSSLGVEHGVHLCFLIPKDDYHNFMLLRYDFLNDKTSLTGFNI